jgi:hypothetical protein
VTELDRLKLDQILRNQAELLNLCSADSGFHSKTRARALALADDSNKLLSKQEPA